MMLRKLALASGIAALLAAGTSYGFGIPKVPGVPAAPAAPGAGGGVTADAVDQFIVTGQQSSNLINNARTILVAALSTKEERAKLLSQTNQLKQGLDAKDKKAIEENKNLQTTNDAQLAAKLKDQAAIDNLKNMSAAQRKLVVDSAMNLAYGVVLQKDQVTVGQNMVSQVASNPMLAAKLPAIKDTVATMAANLGGTGKYLMDFPKLFAALGASVKLPTSADQKPEPVSGGVADFDPQ